MPDKVKRILFVSMFFMVVGIGMAHYLTPGHLILYHDTFRRLSYFPIAIGAMIYGVTGGLIMAVLSCISFVPHLYMFWYQGPEAYYSELSEILFYLAAGLVIGMISGRENRLRKKYQVLSEQLASSYKRLHDQAEKLVAAEKELGRAQKLSLLGHVSASLAHEIKNPLASIKGAAEILADEVGKDHPKHEFIDIMRSEISRLNNSVEDVLAYCRGQQVKQQDQTAPLDKVIEQVVQVMDAQADKKSVDISCAYKNESSGLEPVPAAAMTQVLMNLVLNALEEVPASGKIKISHEIKNDRLVICVDDNGPGLTPEHIETVFQSFVSYKKGGTGLGLPITKKILERLGGTIGADESELGGAKFSISLPCKRGEILNEADNPAY